MPALAPDVVELEPQEAVAVGAGFPVSDPRAEPDPTTWGTAIVWPIV